MWKKPQSYSYLSTARTVSLKHYGKSHHHLDAATPIARLCYTVTQTQFTLDRVTMRERPDLRGVACPDWQIAWLYKRRGLGSSRVMLDHHLVGPERQMLCSAVLHCVRRNGCAADNVREGGRECLAVFVRRCADDRSFM